MDGELEIVFKKSAFKHGLSEEDIKWAFKTVEYDELIEGQENKYRLLGFNTKGNLVEIIYNLVNDHRVNVFHAMLCPDAFFSLLAEQEK
jgi:hypothetical protein